MPECQHYARCKETHRIFRKVLRSPRLGSRLLLGPGRVAELAEMVKEVAPRAEVHHEVQVLLRLEGHAELDDERVLDLREHGALRPRRAERRAALRARARLAHAPRARAL